MKKIEIIKPDDWHVHFREGTLLKKLVPETSKLFNRAVVMPNLIDPIVNTKQALSYKNNILKYSNNNKNFKPLITFYLNDEIKIEELISAFENKIIFAVKLYPSGATTNSSKGVKNILNMYPVFEKMSKHGIPLLIHGEVNDKKVDIFDREKVFIQKFLSNICKNFPSLKITLEHITTKYAVEFINNSSNDIKASITPHHLILNRTDMLEHKIKPHYYCLPILKGENDRKALLDAAFNENRKFFMGTDSAPHYIENKESECGCAGVFNTINSVQMLTQLFENNGMLNKLEDFISKNGALHYNKKINKETITLKKQSKKIHFNKYMKLKESKIKIFKPPFDIFWEIDYKRIS